MESVDYKKICEHCGIEFITPWENSTLCWKCGIWKVTHDKYMARHKKACVIKEVFNKPKTKEKKIPTGMRACHDCGKPTFDYRCPICAAKWRKQYGDY